MSLIANVLGFGAFGVAVRTLQLGIQKKPIFTSPVTHLISAAAFGAVGWGVYELEGRQQVLIDARRQILLANREKENTEYELKKGSASEGH